MGQFSQYEYRKQPGFDMNAFEGANQAIPMKTLVIYCFDPRAANISTLFDHDSLAIIDFEESLNHDIKLLRNSPAVPKHIKLYGFFYEISSGAQRLRSRYSN